MESFQPAPTTFENKPNSRFKKILLLLLVVSLVIVIGGTLFYLTPLKQQIASPTQKQAQQSTKDAIAKVGEELIYKQDLDYLENLLPQALQASSAAEQATLMNQLIRESVILQAANKEKLISLDTSVYNSPQKDYKKRAQLVIQAQDAISNQSSGIKGMVVAIWFNNPPADGTSDTASRKALAYSKISNLHDAVKSKKMTIEQAAEQIKNDTSLASLDILYKENASFVFRAQPDKQITTYPEFSTLLHKLKSGETSDIYEAPEGGYLFGQVQSIVTDRSYANFGDWLAQQMKRYSVAIYK